MLTGAAVCLWAGSLWQVLCLNTPCRAAMWRQQTWESPAQNRLTFPPGTPDMQSLMLAALFEQGGAKITTERVSRCVGASVAASEDVWGAPDLPVLPPEVPVLAAVKNQGAHWSDGEGWSSREQAQSSTGETDFNGVLLFDVSLVWNLTSLLLFSAMGK